MYLVIGTIIYKHLYKQETNCPEPKYLFVQWPENMVPRPSAAHAGSPAHLEEPSLRVHGAVAFSVAEVKHAGEMGAVRPRVGAKAVAVVPVELPVVGLWTERPETCV